ncbi:MAG: hypothetical protein ABJA78_12305 [Ferruginibacter sp.]
MKKRSFIFIANIFMLFSLQLVTVTVMAQQSCNDETIMNTKGSWKKSNDANMKAGNAQVISRIDKMAKVLQAAYPQPTGMEARWYRTMVNSPLINNGAIPYQLNALFPEYYCNTYSNKLEAADETDDWFYVYANHFNWFVEYDQFFTVHKNPVYLLTKKVGMVAGYPVYEGIHNGTSNTGTKYSRAVILTRPGNSPYVPVTRKEYLIMFVKRYEIERTRQLEMISKQPERSVTDQETAKQTALKNMEKSYTAASLERRRAEYLKNYQTDLQKKEALLLKFNKLFDDAEKKAQDLLKTINDVEGAMPAIVTDDYVAKFEKFLTEEEGGRMLVTLNPGYFNNNLPKYVPQFLIVYWRWEKHKSAENYKDQIEKHFDFAALQEMLDK